MSCAYTHMYIYIIHPHNTAINKHLLIVPSAKPYMLDRGLSCTGGFPGTECCRLSLAEFDKGQLALLLILIDRRCMYLTPGNCTQSIRISQRLRMNFQL